MKPQKQHHSHGKSHHKKRHGFEFLQEDFSKESFIEGAFFRPLVLLGAFATFLIGMFLLMLGVQGYPDLIKWGGSAIIVSFVLNIQSIYSSLADDSSYFKTFNLIFKLVLFLAEIIAFNFMLTVIL